MIKFLFGIVIASCLIWFWPEIKDTMISYGIRDYLVDWLQSLNEEKQIVIDIPGGKNGN